MQHSYDFGTTFKLFIGGLALLALCALPVLPFLPLRQLIPSEEPLCAIPSDETETAPLAGGLSPDGNYELRIAKKTDPECPFRYFLQALNKRDGFVSFYLNDPSKTRSFDYAKESSRILWNSDSKLFALADAVNAHSQSLAIYSFEGDSLRKAEESPSSSYLHNAMGRAGLIEIPESCYVEPVSWNGSVLSCKIVFAVESEEESEMYSCDFTLKVEDAGGEDGLRFKLDSMSDAKPYDLDGEEMEEAAEAQDDEDCHAVAASVSNESMPLKGGLSPDKKFEVRVFKAAKPTCQGPDQKYIYGVCRASDPSAIDYFDFGGVYCEYESAADDSFVLWKPDSKCFALVERSLSHTKDISFVAKGEKCFSPMVVGGGSYVDNAMGRVNMAGYPLFSSVEPIGWNGDVLNCMLHFKKDGKDINHSVKFSFKISGWEGEEKAPSSIMFNSMEQPKDEE